MVILIVGLKIFFAIIIKNKASEKGYSSFGWLIYGFIFTIIAFIHINVMEGHGMR